MSVYNWWSRQICVFQITTIVIRVLLLSCLKQCQLLSAPFSQFKTSANLSEPFSPVKVFLPFVSKRLIFDQLLSAILDSLKIVQTAFCHSSFP